MGNRTNRTDDYNPELSDISYHPNVSQEEGGILPVKKSKSNLHYTRGITPKRVTSGGAHLRGLAPGQHSSEETSQR